VHTKFDIYVLFIDKQISVAASILSKSW